MRIRSTVGFLAGGMLLLAALAHALRGFPPLRRALQAEGVGAEVIGALGAGWYFGSAAMAVFGLILIVSAWRERRSGVTDRQPAGLIALGLVVFGAAGWLLRGRSPQFLVFLVVGLLVGAYAWRR